MTKPAVTNPSLPKRVAHVIIVALCTVSTFALLGAERADSRPVRKPAAVAAKPAAVVTAASLVKQAPVIEVASVLPTLPAPELMQDDAAVPAAVVIKAAEPKTRVMRMEVTAYCACTKCCGPNAQGITASGKLVSYNDGKFVAADTGVLPFGTKLVIPGYADGAVVEVADRGGAIKGNKLDLFFNSHTDALIWGRQHLDVEVIE